jgi:hypothetical protein
VILYLFLSWLHYYIYCSLMEAPPINEDEMEQLLEWIDGISFSRPKRNLSRDFSDGVLIAEILKQYHPRLVHLHNYPPASALNAKFNNWKTLNGTLHIR